MLFYYFAAYSPITLYPAALGCSQSSCKSAFNFEGSEGSRISLSKSITSSNVPLVLIHSFTACRAASRKNVK